MIDRVDSRLTRWPSLLCFLLAAALFDGLGWLIVARGHSPITQFEAISAIVCVGMGAWLSILPFWTDASSAIKLDELVKLHNAATQIQNLEKVATQITIATAHWQNVQEHNARAIEAANKISAEMTQEALRFGEFMKRANDAEKATLRLEVEKLRRAEGDWLQVAVRTLDHVFALHRAALHSGQANLIEQLNQFQIACRDVSRRIGLVPFAPAPGDEFDPEQHRLDGGAPAPAPGALVAEVFATGYTFQGQPLRAALVAVDEPALQSPVTGSPHEPADAEEPPANQPPGTGPVAAMGQAVGGEELRLL